MTIASNRRQFLSQSGVSLGSLALSTLLHGADDGQSIQHLPIKARRIIYLFMHGGPSQLDLFDHKPDLRKYHGDELPASVRGDQRLTGMTSGQASFPVTSSCIRFPVMASPVPGSVSCSRKQPGSLMTSALFPRCIPKPLTMIRL